MWFLQTDILLLMLVCSLCAGAALRIAGKWNRQGALWKLMPLLDLGVIWYVSEKLAVFYAGFTIVTFAFTWWLSRVKRGRRLWFALLCLGCLVPLVYSRAAGFWTALPMCGLTMVGIAYNMLKAIDALYYVYYTEEKVPFLTYANYLLFFPVLTAGPVFRYRDFAAMTPRPVGLEEVTYAVKRIVRGLFSKVVLSALAADFLNMLALQSPKIYFSALIPVVSYLVLFFDMAGYASIAIGMGALMGVSVPENFKKPWKAASFTQFWRNWHVTVSDWIREHVYVLFGGRRLSRWQNAGVAMVVMMVMSLWHGFSWLFVVDGLFLGALLAVENLLGMTTVGRRANRYYRGARCLVTNYLFALNSLIFTLSTAQIAAVLGGFFKL